MATAAGFSTKLVSLTEYWKTIPPSDRSGTFKITLSPPSVVKVHVTDARNVAIPDALVVASTTWGPEAVVKIPNSPVSQLLSPTAKTDPNGLASMLLSTDFDYKLVVSRPGFTPKLTVVRTDTPNPNQLEVMLGTVFVAGLRKVFSDGSPADQCEVGTAGRDIELSREMPETWGREVHRISQELAQRVGHSDIEWFFADDRTWNPLPETARLTVTRLGESRTIDAAYKRCDQFSAADVVVASFERTSFDRVDNPARIILQVHDESGGATAQHFMWEFRTCGDVHHLLMASSSDDQTGRSTFELVPHDVDIEVFCASKAWVNAFLPKDRRVKLSAGETRRIDLVEPVSKMTELQVTVVDTLDRPVDDFRMSAEYRRFGFVGWNHELIPSAPCRLSVAAFGYETAELDVDLTESRKSAVSFRLKPVSRGLLQGS